MKNENKINYINLSDKIYFNEEANFKFHGTGFLEKYDRLYDLVKNLLTSKINIYNANLDQFRLIIGLMNWYEKENFNC